MSRAPLSDEAIASFRARLIDKAIELFAEHGYKAVSGRMIAREMGCSPMTPYRYFDDREEMLVAVRDRCFEHMADAQDASLAEVTEPIDRVRALFRASVQFSIDRPAEYRVMFDLEQTPAGHYQHLRSGERRVWHNVRDCIEHAVASGRLAGDAVTIAHLFMVSTHGLMTLNLAERLTLGRTIDDLIDPLLETLIAGCGPER